MKSFASDAQLFRQWAHAIRVITIAAYMLLVIVLALILWRATFVVPIQSFTHIRDIAKTRPAELPFQITSRTFRAEFTPPKISQPQQAKTPDVELVATLMSPDQPPRAFLRSRSTKKTLLLRKGQLIEGFEIKEISEGEVVLQADGQTFVVSTQRRGS